MTPPFRLLRQTRQNLLGLVEGFSLDQLTYIPPGFRNNLYWHLGHVLVTQHLLLYKNSGQPMPLAPEMTEAFRKGSVPDGQGDAETLALIRARLLSSVEQTWQDYQAGHFSTYQPYETSYGYPLHHIEDAIRFNNVHEGLHFGYVQAMRRFVSA